MNSVYDVTPPVNDPKGLEGSVETFVVGPMMAGWESFGDQQSRRDRHRIDATDVDHCLIQLFLSGSLTGAFDGRDVRARTGDICVYDYSRPMESFAEAGATISVVIPRWLLHGGPGERDMHGFVLRRESPRAHMLAMHFRGLREVLPRLETGDAGDFADLTLSMVQTTLRLPGTSPAHDDQVRRNPDRTEVLRFIEKNAASPELTPALLEQHFEMSRTSLYRMFVDEGGVSRVIRSRRLGGAMQELHRSKHRTNLELALAHGFSGEDQFARAFKREFGMTPGQARELRQSDGVIANPEASLHTGFVDRLSRLDAIAPAWDVPASRDAPAGRASQGHSSRQRHRP